MNLTKIINATKYTKLKTPSKKEKKICIIYGNVLRKRKKYPF